MHQHEHDENNAPNQANSAKPADPDAHLADGVLGAQPPLEQKGAHAGNRHKTAAGYFSISAHFGISVAEGSNQPVSKSIVITVEPADNARADRRSISESATPAASPVAR
jgi:hypothetical protein